MKNDDAYKALNHIVGHADGMRFDIAHAFDAVTSLRVKADALDTLERWLRTRIDDNPLDIRSISLDGDDGIGMVANRDDLFVADESAISRIVAPTLTALAAALTTTEEG